MIIANGAAYGRILFNSLRLAIALRDSSPTSISSCF
jgi:sulfur relay (sulfurtransferase) complex TusBCD TusD component (DsrE family)